MSRIPMWRRYLRFWGADPPADIDAEISHHLEELTRYFVGRGMSPDEAARHAARRFGDRARVRAECLTMDHQAVRAAGRRDLLDALAQDARDAARSLTRNPGFTCGAVLILAIGIGLNTTSYSFNKALLFPTVPIGDPPGIVRMWSQNIERGIFVTPVSDGDAAELIASSRSFVDLATFLVQPVTLVDEREAVRIVAMRATVNLFPLLQVSPAFGRPFSDPDVMSPPGRAVMLSDRAWRNRFAADPAIIGRHIRLDGQPHTVVGVMPPDFWFESKDVEVWLPHERPTTTGARDVRTRMVIGRLRPGVTMDAAQADVQSTASRLAREHPRTNQGWDIAVTGLLPFGPGERVFFGLVVTLTSLLLAAGCAHIANLLLARGMERRGEIALRAALGARRSRIIRQLVVESVAIAALGGVCSLLVAWPLIGQIRRILGGRTPFLSDFSLDAAALAVTASLVVLASVLFGLTPAFRSSSVTAVDGLKQSGVAPTASRARRPLASLLIGFEVAVATLALIVTLLYARAGRNVLAIPFGFETANVTTFRIEAPEYKYQEPEAAVRLLTALHRRLQSLPSVKTVGAGTRLPLNIGPGLPTEAIALEGRDDFPGELPWAITEVVTPGYFEALGMRRLAGRTFSEQDTASAPRTAIVSRSMARAYWGEQSPVGRRVRLASKSASDQWLTIVGVVEDVRPFDPTSPQVRHLYVPFAQSSRRALVFFVSTPNAPADHMDAMRSAVREVDRELPVQNLITLSDAVANAMSGVKLGQQSMQANALAALLLALSGVYSVVAFAVARRRREMAIRAALGGSRASIVALILQQALRPALVGVAVGVVLSALTSRAMMLMLFGVNPLDPFTYSLATIALCLAAGVASCVPVLRATRANTTATLRAE